jgi:hypothetical protein
MRSPPYQQAVADETTLLLESRQRYLLGDPPDNPENARVPLNMSLPLNV